MPETVTEPVAQPIDVPVPNSHGETEAPELKFESTPESKTVPEVTAAPEIATGTALESALEPSNPQPSEHGSQPIVRDNEIIRRGGLPFGAVTVLVSVVLISGLFVAAYYLGFLDNVKNLEWLQIENVTTLPDNLAVPEFIPIDPAGFSGVVVDEFVDVPDETGLDLLPLEPEKQEEIPSQPMNYYTRTPNVSMFFTRAMQDESYVYFLPFDGSHTKLENLMRMPVTGGEPEIIPNANENEFSIYSFTLFQSNIITCEYDPATSMYAFYRVPKSAGDAQFLFEYDSPAFMNVHDNKIFMLFTDARKLGIYDPDVDSQPVFINLPLVPAAQYMPAFSVMNGYLYYGISRNGGEESDYLRRSLYTGEVSIMLSSSSLDESWITNACWDDSGNCYYSNRNPETKAYSLQSIKKDASPETLNSFETDGNTTPFIAFDGGELVAQSTEEIIGRYNPEGWSAVVEVPVKDPPYAITKDFLIARDGYYKISDLSYTAFDAGGNAT